MDVLSDDLIWQMGRFLTDKEYVAWAGVCRRHRAICVGLRGFAVRVTGRDMPEDLKRLLRDWPKIWAVRSICDQPLGNLQLRALQELKSLRVLQLDGALLEDKDAFANILRRSHCTLESVALSNCAIFSGILQWEFARLTSVSLHNCQQVDDLTLMSLRECPHLRTLALRECRKITTLGVDFLRGYPSLETIFWERGMDHLVSWLAVTARDIATLRNLFFCNVSTLVTEDMDNLKWCLGLRSFHAIGCEMLLTSAAAAVRAWPQIEIAHFVDCPLVHKRAIPFWETHRIFRFDGCGGEVIHQSRLYGGQPTRKLKQSKVATGPPQREITWHSNWGCGVSGCTKVAACMVEM